MFRQTGFPSIDKPWLKYYKKEAINSALPECTLFEYLYENNKDYISDTALIYITKKITFKEFFKNIDKTAAAFISLGVKEKEIVTVALPSIPEAIYCVYALNKIGAVANMIHPLAGRDETLNYINEVKSKVAVIFEGAYLGIAGIIDKTSLEKVIVVSPADSLPIVYKILYKLKTEKHNYDRAKFIAWKSFVQAGKGTTVKKVKKNCYEMALISHTGGTTGEPKGVMCSDYGCNALMYQLLCNFEYERQECSLNVLPPFVNYSLLESVMAMLAVGFKVVLIPKYEPMDFVKYVRKYRPNQILSIPAYWEAMLRNKGIDKIDMSCFKHLYAGGEKMDHNIETKINKLIQKCGSKTRLYNCMGSTEMMAGATVIYDNCYEIGSVGIPMVQVECKIVDTNSGKELPYDCEGEICFSGATLMIGYYNNPDATNEVIKLHEDGKRWFHSGDIGYINKNGSIFVTGRIKHIAMTRGRDGQVTKIFPDRIEKVIYKYPNVELCCVICVQDNERINYPKAFVILKNKEIIDNAKNELLEICKSNLPEYMIPEKIEFVDELPRTSRGKIDYRALEKMV